MGYIIYSHPVGRCLGLTGSPYVVVAGAKCGTLLEALSSLPLLPSSLIKNARINESFAFLMVGVHERHINFRPKGRTEIFDMGSALASGEVFFIPGAKPPHPVPTHTCAGKPVRHPPWPHQTPTNQNMAVLSSSASM